jgi:hypothetical protein
MVLSTVADICEARGKTAEAVSIMESAVAEEPDNAYYRRRLEELQDKHRRER